MITVFKYIVAILLIIILTPVIGFASGWWIALGFFSTAIVFFALGSNVLVFFWGDGT